MESSLSFGQAPGQVSSADVGQDYPIQYTIRRFGCPRPLDSQQSSNHLIVFQISLRNVRA
jgi:hypothetical protein